LLLLRLANNRLYRLYTWFFILLCFQASQSVGMMTVNQFPKVYGWAYVLTQPVIWPLYIMAVLELYSVALQQHRGIASLSRWVLLGALFLSVAISALTIPADLSGPAGKSPVLVYYDVIERGLLFSLVVFLILITGFLLWTPLTIRRNIVVHASLCSCYFLVSAAALFVRNIKGYDIVVEGVSIALMVVHNCCLALWILLLNRRGEETLLMVRRSWQPEDETRLSRQMDAVNAFLLKSSRK
jgi:hypothetical protein